MNRETLNNNKLIAEFMGAPTNQKGVDREPFYIEDEININVNGHSMQFHQSWDWLMPVVEKIQSMGGGWHLNRGLLQCDLNLQYESVVSFIKWYNKNQKQNTNQ